jgi:hypothetical protein
LDTIPVVIVFRVLEAEPAFPVEGISTMIVHGCDKVKGRKSSVSLVFEESLQELSGYRTTLLYPTDRNGSQFILFFFCALNMILARA